MRCLAYASLTLFLFAAPACDTAGADSDSFSLEVTSTTSGKADAAEQACHYRCDSPCPPNQICIAVCVKEDYGNCGDVGRQCDFLKLCAPGYVYDENSCNCRPATPKDGGCTVDGRFVPAGKSFTAEDGCNTCFCAGDGLVACTKIACFEPTNCNDPSRDYVSKDPALCATINYFCDSGSGFSDECGCGCFK